MYANRILTPLLTGRTIRTVVRDHGHLHIGFGGEVLLDVKVKTEQKEPNLGSVILEVWQNATILELRCVDNTVFQFKLNGTKAVQVIGLNDETLYPIESTIAC